MKKKKPVEEKRDTGAEPRPYVTLEDFRRNMTLGIYSAPSTKRRKIVSPFILNFRHSRFLMTYTPEEVLEVPKIIKEIEKRVELPQWLTKEKFKSELKDHRVEVEKWLLKVAPISMGFEEAIENVNSYLKQLLGDAEVTMNLGRAVKLKQASFELMFLSFWCDLVDLQATERQALFAIYAESVDAEETKKSSVGQILERLAAMTAEQKAKERVTTRNTERKTSNRKIPSHRVTEGNGDDE